MSALELDKLLKRIRYCRNTGEEFIWDNTWINICEDELTQLRADNLRLQKAVDEARDWIAHIIKYYDEEVGGLEVSAGKNWLAANPKEE